MYDLQYKIKLGGVLQYATFTANGATGGYDYTISGGTDPYD